MPMKPILLGAAILLTGTLVSCAESATGAPSASSGQAEAEVMAATAAVAECPETPTDGFAVRTDQGVFVIRASDGELKVLSASASGDGTFTVSQHDPTTLDLSLAGLDGTFVLGAALDGDALRLDLDGALDTQIIDLGTLGSITLRTNGEVLELVDLTANAGVEYSIATEGDLLRIRFDGEVQKELAAQLVDGSITLGLGGDLATALAVAGIDADAAVQTGSDDQPGVSVSGDVDGNVETGIGLSVSGDTEAEVGGAIDVETDIGVSATTP